MSMPVVNTIETVLATHWPYVFGSPATHTLGHVLHSHRPVGDDRAMAAPSTAVTATARDPEYWPIGVDGSRTVIVDVEDGNHPEVQATFEFGAMPQWPLSLIRFHADSMTGLRVPSMRDLPVNRWEKAARAAAEQRMVATGPHGQHVAPESVAEDLIREKFPELSGAKGGNALRRRNGLLHLALMYQEYKEAEAMGAQNPAQVLAEVHSVTAATVRGWIHRARKEGLVPESQHPNASGKV